MDKTNVKHVKEIEIIVEGQEESVIGNIYQCTKCNWRFIGECERYNCGYDSEGVDIPNYCPMCGKEIENCID